MQQPEAFTLDQIHNAFKKVKSGADFPRFVQDLKRIGVTHYDTYVANGRTTYYGANNFAADDKPKYALLTVNTSSSSDKLKHSIAIHQQGQTDYLTFCHQAADAGVEKWTTHMLAMTVTYLDKQGNVLIAEPIPPANETDKFKLTIHMVSSLDGIIAKKDNSVSWFETSSHYEKGVSGQDSEEFLKTIDCYVMGSRTYEHALELSKSYGWAYGDKPTIVVTSRNLSTEKKNIKFYSGDLNKLVCEQLKPNYKNVWLVGGAKLVNDFIRLKLINEIRMSVLPIILGEGTPFFDHLKQEQVLHLKDVTAYKNGMIELCYEIRRE